MRTVPGTLDEILEDIWVRLARGKADRRSPFHTPVVCSVDADKPAPRLMVLREVSREPARLRFHTDARSPKVNQFKLNPHVSILGYDPDARIQITVGGIAAIEADGPASRSAWERASLTSRRCYLANPGPGAVLTNAGSGLPPHLLDRAPTQQESEAGWENFSVLLVSIESIEWVRLTSNGNFRARYLLKEGQWSASWLHP
jgi:hypothetical protein